MGIGLAYNAVGASTGSGEVQNDEQRRCFYKTKKLEKIPRGQVEVNVRYLDWKLRNDGSSLRNAQLAPRGYFESDVPRKPHHTN